MAEMNTTGPVVPLQEILDAAVEFGLSREEVWQTVDEALYRAPANAVPDCLDELTAALARSILAKQRRIAAGQRLL
jgi:hypothetical protein